MAVSYPDAIGEHVATSERYYTGGLQYAGYLEPAAIATGQVSNLFLFMQNMLNVPMTVTIKVSPPLTGLFRGRKPLLRVGDPVIQIELAEAEAGLLTLPVTTTEQTGAGQFGLTIEVKAATKGRGERVRPAKSTSSLETKFIDSPVGLNLVSSLGATYSEKSAKKAVFSLNVTGKKRASKKKPALKYQYDKIWDTDDAQIFTKSIQEINSRRAKLKTALDMETLYANLYAESVKRFANAGLPLRIGEAITLAKILTYTCQYFLSNPDRVNGLLLPIWERALSLDADTTDALDVIRLYGYHHLLRVSVALSFGVIGRATGQQLWSQEERQAVAGHIADTVEMGEKLDIEFLYLPLLIAGTQISKRLILPDEGVENSLALMKQARLARPDLFKDKDMARANQVYNQIMKKALA
ncbi:MAG TPA: hypothetical protein P5526_22535 [Anaerolineae bacterium]|nr:hypothetical protein [Anaerolineae bacterium]